MSVVEPSASGALRLPWGVAALLLATSDALAARFGAVVVRGELSGFARAASGHCYFSLKDADGAPALLRCAMFRRAAALADFVPADGQQVEARGRLTLYEARGELQLVVESLQRVGAGNLYEEFLRRKARLQAEGLFDAARKRALPALPVRIGVVTSLAAAALRDVATALRRRSPQVELVVYPAPVQGADAPAALVGALTLAAQRAEVDLLLLVRGGGSLEDLWAFNDERLVRAVAASPIPVVCGVGHETDVTLCDLAADLRAATPTAAAELAAPARAELQQLLQGRAGALTAALQRQLQQREQRLDTLQLRLARPTRTLQQQGQRLSGLRLRLDAALAQRRQGLGTALQRRADSLLHAMRQGLERRAARLDTVRQRLQAQDPAQVLHRGYAWVEDAGRRPIVSAGALSAGQSVTAVWADGRAALAVRQVALADASDSPAPTPTLPTAR